MSRQMEQAANDLAGEQHHPINHYAWVIMAGEQHHPIIHYAWVINHYA